MHYLIALSSLNDAYFSLYFFKGLLNNVAFAFLGAVGLNIGFVIMPMAVSFR